jgi:RimJ/RimL family protein N-acetyltransferase
VAECRCVLALPFAPVLPLRTDRLVLRAFVPEDFDELLEFHAHPEAVRYVPFDPRDADSMAANLKRKISGGVFRSDGDLIELAVELADGGRLIGDLLLVLHSVADATVEVGYIFNPAYAGHGYATESVRAALGLVFDALGAHRVTAVVDARNEASLAVCERAGMRREAEFVAAHWFKGEWATEIHYGLLHRNFEIHIRPSPDRTMNLG